MDPEHIEIVTDLRLGARLRNLVDGIARARAEANFLRAIMDKQVSAGAYTFVASRFGVVAGAGQVLYNLHSGAMAALNAPEVEQYIDRLG